MSRPSCFSLPRDGITGVHHRDQVELLTLEKKVFKCASIGDLLRGERGDSERPQAQTGEAAGLMAWQLAKITKNLPLGVWVCKIWLLHATLGRTLP